MRRRMALIGIIFFTALSVGTLSAQDFPTKQINVYIGYSAGGSTDITVRAIAAEASKILNQPIICINQPGANGSLVLGKIKNEKPDGYNISSAPTSAFSIMPHMREVPYDPFKDFDFIMQYGLYQHGIAVRPETPWKTVNELIEYAQKNPNKVKYVTSGMGSGGHRTMMFLENKYGIKWQHLPMKSGMEGVTAILGGHVDVISQTAEWKEQVRAGQLRLLVITSPQRMKAFPDVPTLKEIGIPYEVDTGICFVTPIGTPPAVVKKLQDAFAEAMKSQPFIDTMDKFDMPIIYKDSTTLTKYLIEESKETKDQFEKIGVKKE